VSLACVTARALAAQVFSNTLESRYLTSGTRLANSIGMDAKKTSKRAFRGREIDAPDYPKSAGREQDRRSILTRLGALVSAAALGVTLSACGSRPVPGGEPLSPDGGPPSWVTVDAGGAPMMDSMLDEYLPPYPDMGTAPDMDAPLDGELPPGSDGYTDF